MMRFLTIRTTVAPAKAGAGLFFSTASLAVDGRGGSQAPDQVRGDAIWSGSVRP